MLGDAGRGRGMMEELKETVLYRPWQTHSKTYRHHEKYGELCKGPAILVNHSSLADLCCKKLDDLDMVPLMSSALWENPGANEHNRIHYIIWLRSPRKKCDKNLNRQMVSDSEGPSVRGRHVCLIPYALP